MEEKYRTIKKSNPAFAKRIGGVAGGADLLLAAGFALQTKEGVEFYILTPGAAAWPLLVAAREAVQRAAEAARSEGGGGGTSAAAGGAPGGTTAPGLGGLGGFPPGGMPGGDAMQRMMNDVSFVCVGAGGNSVVGTTLLGTLKHHLNVAIALSVSRFTSTAEHATKCDGGDECE